MPGVEGVGVPTTVDALLDVDWLGRALDLDSGERIVRAEVVDSSQTLAQKVRFEVESETADGALREPCSTALLAPRRRSGWRIAWAAISIITGR